jgi:hypothetical protein
MDSLQNNSSLVDLLNTFGKDGEFHKDVIKLKDSIDSLTKTLVGRAGGKKDTESEETDKSEEAPTKTLMGNLKDFGRGFKDGILGKKEMPITPKSSKALPVQDDGSNKVLSDMVDVLKIISEDKIQLKILSEISTIKNLFSNSVAARTIEPNNETEKQEDREKLAEAIARRLSELDVFGGDGPGGFFDRAGKEKGNPKKPSGPKMPKIPTPSGKQIASAAAALAAAAGVPEIATAVAVTGAVSLGANAADEVMGKIGINEDNAGKRLQEYPKDLDAVQNKIIDIATPGIGLINDFSQGVETAASDLGAAETKQALTRKRIEANFARVNDIINGLKENKDLTDDQKNKILELERQRQIIVDNILYERENKDAATQASTRSVEPKPAEASPAAPTQMHSKEAIAEEELAKEATRKLNSKKSAPANITPKEKDNIGMAESSDAEAAKKPLVEIKPVTNEEKPVPAGPDIVPAESSKSADQLSQMTGENSQLQENSRSLSAAPISITSNQSSSNDSTELDLEKITPYSNYRTFDRWQYSRSGDYDHA